MKPCMLTFESTHAHGDNHCILKYMYNFVDPTTGSDFLSVTCEDGGARVVRDLLASDTYGNLYVQVVYNNSIEVCLLLLYNIPVTSSSLYLQ